MSEINHNDFEAAVLREAERILESYASELMQSGLRAELIGLEKRNSGTTELTIYIWRDANLIDAFEFIVTEYGKPAATEGEITSWLREQLREAASTWDRDSSSGTAREPRGADPDRT